MKSNGSFGPQNANFLCSSTGFLASLTMLLAVHLTFQNMCTLRDCTSRTSRFFSYFEKRSLHSLSKCSAVVKLWGHYCVLVSLLAKMDPYMSITLKKETVWLIWAIFSGSPAGQLHLKISTRHWNPKGVWGGSGSCLDVESCIEFCLIFQC